MDRLSEPNTYTRLGKNLSANYSTSNSLPTIEHMCAVRIEKIVFVMREREKNSAVPLSASVVAIRVEIVIQSARKHHHFHRFDVCRIRRTLFPCYYYAMNNIVATIDAYTFLTNGHVGSSGSERERGGIHAHKQQPKSNEFSRNKKKSWKMRCATQSAPHRERKKNAALDLLSGIICNRSEIVMKTNILAFETICCVGRVRKHVQTTHNSRIHSDAYTRSPSDCHTIAYATKNIREWNINI